MRNGLCTLLPVTVCMLLVAIEGLPALAEPLMLHVAVNGDDAGAGTEQAPFRTLTGARDAIRALKQQGTLPEGGVRVLIHGGTYELEQPFALGPEDSGTASAPIVYAAADAEQAVISGGRRISGLQRNADGSWSTTIPAAARHGWVFRQLFVNGRRYIPARSPNDGQFHLVRGVPPEGGSGTSKDRFVFKGNDIQAWPNVSEIELRIYFSWNGGSFPIKSVDPATRMVTLGGPAVWELPKPGMASNAYIVQNHPGACDAPGEWQLNRDTGELRIIPFDDEDIGAAEVFAPVHERVVAVEGVPEENRYVEHVRFDGLSFRHGAWVLPPEGFSCAQAASALGAAVEFRAARHCAVTGCEVAHVGRYGIAVGVDCSDNTIQRNHLHDLGGGGIRVGTADRPAIFERLAHHTLVDNNFIHDGGHIHPGATGIYMAYGRSNTFSHNEVCDLRYTGISLGWTWDIYRSGTRENIVEYNHVHHVMRVLEDGGGIYSLGLTPGSIIRNNLVHNVGTPPHAIGHGIYLDGGSSGVLCENNICHDCGHGGIRIQHGASCLTVLNNIVAFCGFGLGIDSERTNIFQYNIVYMDGDGTPFRFVPEWQNYNKIIDYNLYYHASNPDFKFLSFTFGEWQKKEGVKDIWYTPRMDAHSRIADPKFVDVAARDFRLQPDSPALGMGFRQIDMTTFGLYGDAEWTSLPKQFPLPPLLPEERSSGMLLVSDDFDDAQVGQKPAYAAVVEDVDAGAYLEVSDKRALSPPHSLRFVDAADVTYHMPHMYYTSPIVGDFTLTVSFDLYREPGAMLWTEWRHTPGYAKVGPCLHIAEDGQLLFQEKRPSETYLPAEEWLHFELTDGLGAFSDGLWDLRITRQSGEVLFEGADLPCDPEFSRILWLGFVSSATGPTEMYLDNVVMKRVDGG